jgi:hypothetical protein
MIAPSRMLLARQGATLRSQQLGRMRNSSCTLEGAPRNTVGTSARLNTRHFTGLYLLLVIFVSIALLASTPAQAFFTEYRRHIMNTIRYYMGRQNVNELSLFASKSFMSTSRPMLKAADSMTLDMVEAIMSMGQEEGGEGGDSEKARTYRMLFAKLTEPPPTTLEWRAEADKRLGKLESMLERHDTMLERILEKIEGKLNPVTLDEQPAVPQSPRSVRSHGAKPSWGLA